MELTVEEEVAILLHPFDGSKLADAVFQLHSFRQLCRNDMVEFLTYTVRYSGEEEHEVVGYDPQSFVQPVPVELYLPHVDASLVYNPVGNLEKKCVNCPPHIARVVSSSGLN